MTAWYLIDKNGVVVSIYNSLAHAQREFKDSVHWQITTALTALTLGDNIGTTLEQENKKASL